METKRFGLRTILTSTTGFLLTESDSPDDNGIGKLHELLEWMTGDSVFTHQLPRVNEPCAMALIEWFPELAKINSFNDDLSSGFAMVTDPDKAAKIEALICQWMERFKEECGAKEFYDVPRLTPGLVKHVDPIQELVEQVGAEKVIVI